MPMWPRVLPARTWRPSTGSLLCSSHHAIRARLQLRGVQREGERRLRLQPHPHTHTHTHTQTHTHTHTRMHIHTHNRTPRADFGAELAIQTRCGRHSTLSGLNLTDCSAIPLPVCGSPICENGSLNSPRRQGKGAMRRSKVRGNISTTCGGREPTAKPGKKGTLRPLSVCCRLLRPFAMHR